MIRVVTVLAVSLSLGGLFLWGLLYGSDERDVESARLNRDVLPFELPLYPRYQGTYGPTLDLGAYLGDRPMVVNFWATWCGPCYDEAPHLQAAWERHGNEVLFVGVQTQDRGKRTEGAAFLDRFAFTFPNVIDDASRVSIDYGLFGVPETFFVRADGTLMEKHTGPVTLDLLEEKIAELTPS